ncbi:hypothetical protein AB0K92_16110 [Streptomyces sp. NPDC052687]|uniref:hypothetical protein n=1 Tax=Streptomyces sp. NPDC052687 TaxID=3154759 RepID=UPI00343386C9
MGSKEVARRTSKAAGSGLTWNSVGDLPRLEVDDLENEDQASLTARGAAYAREYNRIQDASTIMLRNIAVVIVALRKQLGDWKGQTHEYRQIVADMYRAANLPPDSQGTIQASVRYHVGNELRRYLTPRELKRTGLLPESPLERQQDVRATRAAIVKATTTLADAERVPAQKAVKKSSAKKAVKGVVKAEVVQRSAVGSEIKATADQIRLAEVAVNLLGQLNLSTIDRDMTDGQRAKLAAHLAAIEERAREIRAHMENASSEA